MRWIFAAAAAIFGLAACTGTAQTESGALPGALGLQPQAHHTNTAYPLQHIVIMVQENRSFDNLFATFPGADGTKVGHMEGHGPVKLREADLAEKCDFGHSYKGFVGDYNGGKMNGFGLEGDSYGCPKPAGLLPYQYVNPTEIAPYWFIAKQYVLADHMFQTHGSDSYSAHQDLIRGGTMIDGAQRESLIDSPSAMPWGCDAPPGTRSSVIVWTGKRLVNKHDRGPFPCTTSFPPSGNYETLRDLLDAASISWKYYSPPVLRGHKLGPGSLWNAFDTIAAVRYGPEWGTNVPLGPNFQKQIFSDISGGTLPAVSWVIPDAASSDHPGSSQKDLGPSWVASVINAIGLSSYWDSTAIIVVWDDWGGFYDHVPPPFLDRWGGLGFRVPMFVVSPYAREFSPNKPGYVSHTQYEFGSILQLIEANWSLGIGALHTTDARAKSMADCFDFTQPPRTFAQIPSSYSREYFLRQPPSYKPLDSE